MGTNYYLRLNVCKHCGRTSQEIHIGKASMGWKFAFRAYQRYGNESLIVTSLKDWKDQFKLGGIYDEYGKKVSVKSFLSMIKNKQTGKDGTPNYTRDGYEFYQYDFC